MLFLARQAVEEYDRWMHGLYLTHSQGERRGKHRGVGHTCALITLLSFRAVLAVRSFPSFRCDTFLSSRHEPYGSSRYSLHVLY